MINSNTPVVFIHGLWLHATSWAPWVDLFNERRLRAGRAGLARRPADTVAETRANPTASPDVGIEEVTAHYRAIIDGLGSPPVLDRALLRRDDRREAARARTTAPAAIAIDAAQIKGVLPLPLSALHATLPVFKNPANKHRAVTLTAEQFRYSFGNALSEDESEALYEQWTIAAPGRAALRGRSRQLLPALARQGGDGQRRPRSAAAHHGRQGPHGA